MVATVNSTGTSTGVVITPDSSGVLALQTGGTTAITVDASQKTSIVNDATISGLTVGKGGASVTTNTAVGVSALASVPSSSYIYNTAVGYQALTALNGGSQNTACGYTAMAATTSGGANASFGDLSLKSNTTGNYNSALGSEALQANTTGSNNVAVGQKALQANTTASNNIAVGYQAGYTNTTGGNFSAFGSLAGYTYNSTTENYGSSFLGQRAGQFTTSGNDNTFVGGFAGRNTTSGSYNVSLGGSALIANTTGANNIALGYLANNFSTTGSYITAIGYNAFPNAVGDTNELIISCVTGGVGGKGTNTGFITVGTGGMYQGNNSAAWSIASDQRLKKNIVDNTDGLEKITQIRVRNFEYRLPEEVTELDSKNAIAITGVQLGAIAQEIKEVLPNCVKTESSGVMSVDSTNLTWHMVNAIKDLKAINDTQAETINALTARIVALEQA